MLNAFRNLVCYVTQHRVFKLVFMSAHLCFSAQGENTD
jgi:hypothetical protein